MSLLIKALEQAARNRNKSASHQDTSASVTSSSTPALDAAPLQPSSTARVLPTLEPLSSRATTHDATSERSDTLALLNTESSSLDTAAADRRAVRSSASAPNVDAQHEYPRAVDGAQTGGGILSNVSWFMQTYPLATIGGVSALLGVAFSAYVYLEIAQPVRVVASKPALHTPATVMSSAKPDAASPGVAPSSVTDASNAAHTISAAAMMPAQTRAEPQREAGVIRTPPSSSADDQARNAEPLPLRASTPVTRSDGAVSVQPLRTREAITVVATTRQPRMNPELTQAYSALQAGNVESAHKLYVRVLQSDPHNVDALLGMAYIAAHDNRPEEEITLYMRILQVYPRHGAAQAALISIMGKADPVLAETRMKQLIAKEPSAFLHFVLGNVYADQSLWSQAHLSYFQAHHLEPENPDYAYNLAIGLDHLRQSKVALNFYRRAEQLAAIHGRTHFDPARVRERITALAAQLE